MKYIWCIFVFWEILHRLLHRTKKYIMEQRELQHTNDKGTRKIPPWKRAKRKAYEPVYQEERGKGLTSWQNTLTLTLTGRINSYVKLLNSLGWRAGALLKSNFNTGVSTENQLQPYQLCAKAICRPLLREQSLKKGVKFNLRLLVVWVNN